MDLQSINEHNIIVILFVFFHPKSSLVYCLFCEFEHLGLLDVLFTVTVRSESGSLCVLIRVQVLLSGGVDSTVCTALLNKALNQEQVIAVHIDNGFMRKRESQSVEEALTKLGIKLKGNIQKVPFGTPVN